LVIKIGFIGYRNHAKKLIELIENRNDCKIEYIFHPKKKNFDNKSTNNFKDLFNTNAIFISSPNHTHFNYIQKLKSYKGYIFCEKPPGISLLELEKLNNIEERRKKKIFFNFNYRFSELNSIIKNLIKTKKIGKIVHINIISNKGLAFKKGYSKSWRSDGKRNLHNIIETVSIHFLDLINLHLNEFENGSYFPTLISKKGTSFDTSSLFLKYKNNITVHIMNSYATPLINDFTILGTNGTLYFKQNKLEIYSPREVFDKNGFYDYPPLFSKQKYNFEEDYHNSLEKSVGYFITKVKQKKPLVIKDFNTSLITNRIILNLEKE
jgi:predicted dehydrogenase|tara:strand:+ start:6718 stop:7683 length:966 start_codon:yes stop_codon:yes gene_type:complete